MVLLLCVVSERTLLPHAARLTIEGMWTSSLIAISIFRTNCLYLGIFIVISKKWDFHPLSSDQLLRKGYAGIT